MEEKKTSKRDLYGGEDDWSDLTGYVKNHIMQLPYNCKIPQIMILRLDGLSKGNYISNNKIKPMATYQYKDILTAFKVAAFLMNNKTDFKSSEHRFNYAMTIVESKLNDIVIARKKKEEQEEKSEEVLEEVRLRTDNEKAEYKPKNPIEINPEWEELW